MVGAMPAFRALSVLLVLAGVGLAAAGAWAQTGERPVLVGDIRGIINPVMAGYVARVVEEGERTGAEAVVFTMDTPGGLSDSTREINQRLLAARVPVVVYVAPEGARAGSAGVYIAYAAHLAAMAPTTNIGSATPVSMGENGEQQLSAEMRAKVTNDAVAQIRALAELRGRNPDFAEQAVRQATNLQASEALRQNVVNYVAPDLPDLLRQMDGARVRTADGERTLATAGAPLRNADMSALERFLLAITNPTIAYLLLSIGGLGLVVELYNPGSIFPGVIGGISLLLAFYALGTLPVNYAALGLIGFGLLLFALEPFVVSHGILGAGGAVAFFIGSLLLVNAPEGAPYLQVALPAIVGMTGTLAVLFLGVLAAVLRTRRARSVTGQEGLVGAIGVVRQPLQPGIPGMVHLQGETWQAVSATPAAIGEQVVVEAISGLLLTVRPVEQAQPTRPPEPSSSSAERHIPAARPSHL